MNTQITQAPERAETAAREAPAAAATTNTPARGSERRRGIIARLALR